MKNKGEAAFSRLDLFAVIAIIGLFTLIVFPAMGAIARDANSDLCQDNQRQLMRAMHLYVVDNGDYFPYNRDTGSSQWLTHTANSIPDSTNAAKLFDPNFNKLARYLDGRANVFKCPSDTSVATIGTNNYPRVRSVSMNHAVGTRNDVAGVRVAVDAPWLDGNHSHVANTTYRCYARLAEMVNPPPSQIWIFLDENPYSINDGNYAGMGPQTTSGFYHWIDWPASYHNNGAGFAFADGHAETKIWVAKNGSGQSAPSGAGFLSDIDWIAQRTTGLVANER